MVLKKASAQEGGGAGGGNSGFATLRFPSPAEGKLIFEYKEVLFMKEKFCCFTGHRKINQNEMIEVVYRLGDEIEGLIDMGVNNFISGGALGFDTIAALSVILLRDQGYRIRLIMALPCIGQDKLWNEKDREIYALILKYADEVRYIYEGEYKKDCMRERNKYMVDNSSYCISYLRRGRSGTSQTVAYAQKQGLEIIRL